MQDHDAPPALSDRPGADQVCAIVRALTTEPSNAPPPHAFPPRRRDGQRIGRAVAAGASGRFRSTPKRASASASARAVVSMAFSNSAADGTAGIRFVALEEIGYRNEVA